MLAGLKTFKKKTLGSDLLSGFIIALVSIPISMGYAQIAGLPPQYGLYGSVLPVVLFALFSSSPQYIFGVDAAPAALVGGTLAGLGIALGSAQAAAVVPVITFFTGMWLLLFFLIKFGRLTRFVSSPVMGGFITGICTTIILMQTPKLFGGQAGAGELRELLPHIAEEFSSSFSIWSAVLSVICITAIQICRKLVPKAPAAAIIMLAAAASQYLTDFCTTLGVNTLPNVERGLAPFILPDFTLENCYTGAVSGFTVALVIAAETLLAERSFAMKGDYKIKDSSELMAYSVCNLSAAFIGVCPVNGSVSRSSMNVQFGGKSQVTSLVAAGIMTLILLFGTGFISYLPVPVLTSIVVCALWSGTEFSLAKKLFKSNRKEFFIFIAAFLGVLIFGTIYGVVIGVILSFLNVIIRESRPTTSFLGVIKGRNHFYDLATYAKAMPIKNVIIYRFNGNLFFATIDCFVSELEAAVRDDTKYIIVDAGGIGSIDSTAAQSLAALYERLSKKGIRLFFAEHIPKVNEELRTYGLGYIIENGGVRKTITDALASVGYYRPYLLCDRTEVRQISEKTAILQEFEWAFGSDAQHYLDMYTRKILLGAKAHLDGDIWEGVSPISEHVLLDYMETHSADLSTQYDIDEKTLRTLINDHRKSLVNNGYVSHEM